MTELIAPALRQVAHNERAIHRHATAPSRNVWNATQEPITAIKPTPLACSGCPGCRCAGSTVCSLFAGVFCPRKCRWYTLRRNASIEVWCLRRRRFAKRHDVSTSLGAGTGAQSCVQFS